VIFRSFSLSSPLFCHCIAFPLYNYYQLLTLHCQIHRRRWSPFFPLRPRRVDPFCGPDSDQPHHRINNFAPPWSDSRRRTAHHYQFAGHHHPPCTCHSRTLLEKKKEVQNASSRNHCPSISHCRLLHFLTTMTRWRKEGLRCERWERGRVW